MVNILLGLLAFVPFVIIAFFVYARGLRKLHVMPPVCALVGLMGIIFWGMKFSAVLAAFLQGLWLSLQIILLMYSSLFFVEVLKQTKTFYAMSRGLEYISKDRRIQVIIIAFFLCSALESILGFGLANGVASFLLMGIGVPPTCAFMMSMMGPVAASAFSMLGIPIFFGLVNGLDQPVFVNQIFYSGITLDEYLKPTNYQMAVFMGIIAALTPLFMIMMMTRFFGRRKIWTAGLSMAPFAVYSGLAFAIPFTLTAIFIGPEFASLIGGLVGFAFAITAARVGFLIPHHHTWDFKPLKDWEANWSAGEFRPPDPHPMVPWKAWLPFLILGILAVVSRLPFLPINDWFQNHFFEYNSFLNTTVSLNFHPLYLSCAIMLFITSLLLIIIFRLGIMNLASAFVGTCGGTWAAIINWTFIMPMMCIYMHSAVNSNGLPGMLELMAQLPAHIPFGNIWGPFISPAIGTLGTFFAESNTLSNMMMSTFQFSLADTLGISTTLFLALQMSGAAIGNMIAMHYLVRGGITVGMLGWEGPMARHIIIPVIWCLIIMGIIGVIAANCFQIPNPLIMP